MNGASVPRLLDVRVSYMKQKTRGEWRQRGRSSAKNGFGLVACNGVSFLIVDLPLLVFRALRLMLFVILMLPAFFVAFQFYLSSTSVIRNIEYGNRPRNYLDLCLPGSDFQTKRPVLVFFTGGV